MVITMFRSGGIRLDSLGVPQHDAHEPLGTGSSKKGGKALAASIPCLHEEGCGMFDAGSRGCPGMNCVTMP